MRLSVIKFESECYLLVNVGGHAAGTGMALGQCLANNHLTVRVPGRPPDRDSSVLNSNENQRAVSLILTTRARK